MSKSYNVFISHSWDYDSSLRSLKALLNKEPNLIASYEEVTFDSPINSVNRAYIRSVLSEKIKNTDVFLVVAGMYAAHSDWMQWEIETAIKNNIPVIGITPRGAQRIPKIVTDNAKVIVSWYTPSIVTAIKNC